MKTIILAQKKGESPKAYRNLVEFSRESIIPYDTLKKKTLPLSHYRGYVYISRQIIWSRAKSPPNR